MYFKNTFSLIFKFLFMKKEYKLISKMFVKVLNI